MRRTVSIAGWTLVWSGLMILGWVTYELFVTDLFNARTQAQAREVVAAELEVRRRDLAPPVTLPPQPEAVATATSESETDPVLLHAESVGSEGEPFAVMRIPEIGVDDVVFTGVNPETLQLGPGHMPWTPAPGQPGNSVVSGHRTTHGRPFFDLDLLAAGDAIEVDTAVGTHTFTVREVRVVEPTDVWVTGTRVGSWLTLTTCNPKFSARERLVIFAELTDGPNLAYARQIVEQAAASLS